MSLRLILTSAAPPRVSAQILPLARLREQGRDALADIPCIESGDVSD
jgi:hypothetical protein